MNLTYINTDTKREFAGMAVSTYNHLFETETQTTVHVLSPATFFLNRRDVAHKIEEFEKSHPDHCIACGNLQRDLTYYMYCQGRRFLVCGEDGCTKLACDILDFIAGYTSIPAHVVTLIRSNRTIEPFCYTSSINFECATVFCIRNYDDSYWEKNVAIRDFLTWNPGFKIDISYKIREFQVLILEKFRAHGIGKEHFITTL